MAEEWCQIKLLSAFTDFSHNSRTIPSLPAICKAIKKILKQSQLPGLWRNKKIKHKRLKRKLFQIWQYKKFCTFSTLTHLTWLWTNDFKILLMPSKYSVQLHVYASNLLVDHGITQKITEPLGVRKTIHVHFLVYEKNQNLKTKQKTIQLRLKM